MNYFFRKNNWKQIQDHFKKDDFSENDVLCQIEGIFKSFMCSLIDKEIWIAYLNSAKETKKVSLSEREVKDLIKQYAFCEVENILKDTSLTDFRKQRKIKSILISWEPYRYEKAYYSDYLRFRLKDWEYFTEHFGSWVEKGVTQIRMIQYVQVRASQDSNQENEIVDYNRFPFEEVTIKSLDKKHVPFTTFLVQAYFSSSSHFEGDIFWFNNEIPCYLYNKKNELIHEKIFSKDSFFQCPWNCLPVSIKNKLKDFLFQKTPFRCKFMQSKLNYDGKKSIASILEKYFNIIGRVSPVYGFSKLHESLSQKLEKNVCVLEKLDEAPKQLLFPEYYFQTEQVRKELDSMWKETQEHFFQEIYHYLFDESCQVFYSFEPPKNYRSVEKDLTYFIEKVNLFDYITIHKRVYKYINLDLLFCNKAETVKQKNNYSIEHTTKEIDNYLQKLID